jgi:prevent-host-death family protein
MKATALHHEPEVRTIAAGEFKAKCLKLMDEAVLTQKPVTITKRGKVVGKFVPVSADKKSAHSFIGAGKGMMTIHGDIVSALPNEWAVLEDDD